MEVNNIIMLNQDQVEIDGKIFEKLEETPVIFATHPKCERAFIFDIGELPLEAVKGNYVIVETMYGDKVAFCEDIKYLQKHEIIEHGAYFPLKKIKRVATHEEINKAYEDDMPF